MKSFIVFGCGRFGSTVATTLAELGNDVLAIDVDFDKVQSISDEVTAAVQCDVLDENATKDLGLKNFDIAVVAIGTNLEAAIMATIISKEAGIDYIVAKANGLRHGSILEKVGAHKIIYPEIDMGFKVAHNLTSNNILDYIQLSPDFSIAEIKVVPEWINKSIDEVQFRKLYNVTILGIESQEKLEISPSSKRVLLKDDILVLLGSTTDIQKIEKM
ncbi:trk system potassium uptake protein TrkA [Anaerosphaera aminiphila DSM 21120]|uniref:Trk system potassium uptake protein TrkA n=1 Tax=Anaerosphaera aminiphila DSM 21120 TaxID=1120995 RepID=A0A1M5NPG1_9FIRM|nr:TrkA family potassium uptake protein [Anaerosphaera aminiphila]SHG91446.1 trk system potassium uptake protein TrkA [Anaerosphaera aminiphila DSM 21120]